MDPAGLFGQDGAAVWPDVFCRDEVAGWKSALGLEPAIQGGQRNILDHELVQEIVRDRRVSDILSRAFVDPPFAVRAIVFDKSPEHNWALDFHQDTKIAVRRRLDKEGYTSWSEKAGVDHVQPPVEVLSRQVAFRIHLDDCSMENGPVTVLPGTHLEGRLSATDVSATKQRILPKAMVGNAGSVLMFRSLLLHGSPRATCPSRRRVLHIEFADCVLDGDLEWAWHVPCRW